MDVGIGDWGRSFLAWWGRELAATLPDAIRTQLFGGGARLFVAVEPDALVLELVGPAGTCRRETVSRSGLTQDRAARRALASMAGAAEEVVLRLPQSQLLTPVLDLPISAAEALEQSLADEIARRTPFRRGDIYWDWRVRASDVELERLYVEVLIARRGDVADALAAARSAGLSPNRVDRFSRPGDHAFNLLPAEARERRHHGRARLVRPLALAVLALAIAWGVLALERRKAELEVLEARLAELRRENEAVSAMEIRSDELAASLTFLAERKLSAVSAIEMLADVTRRLPDGDWLYSYTAQDGTLLLQGVSRDASRLPNLLERSEYLSGVAFAAPVRRDAQNDRDEFAIKAFLGGPG